MNKKNKIIIIVGIVVVVAALLATASFLLFGAPQSQAEQEILVVSKNQTEEKILDKLKSQDLIRNKFGLNLVLTLKGKHDKIAPGGYKISKNMNVWEVVEKITSEPDMKWVVVPEGLRKEQIGEILAETFDWSDEEHEKWNTVYTKMKVDYLEGTYFPDTYLIPTDEGGLKIAERMSRRFDEQFAPYVGQFAEQNILWTTGLKLASVIQREAGGKSDMPLIAGILWNRLLQEINLEVDATVQYARGKTDAGWWAPIKSEDIVNIDSPYNTYKYKGLPPYPICNPGIDSIEAVLNPTETDCLFYIHDNNRQIHCAKTFEEHNENIEKYLK